MFSRFKGLENNFSVSKAAIIVGFFTLVAKLVALARDSMLASKIGAGDTLDIYYAAFRLPDFIFNLLVLGTLSVAFIPVFTEWLIKDKPKAYRIANSVLNISLLGMGAICLILLIFSAPLAKILVPGFSPEKLQRTIQLIRLFLLSPIIFTVSNVFTSILSSYKKFLVISLAPILYNLGILFGLFFLYPKFGLMGLGVGVILGALLHMLVQMREVIRHGFSWQLIIDWQEPTLRKFGRLFLPRIIGMDNSQISLLVATTVGSILATGSVTIFNFANNLQAVPLGIFAYSVSAASFPALSEHFAMRDEQAFVRTLGKSMAQVLFFIIPIAALMFLFRMQIVGIILGHGKFEKADTVLTFTTMGILTFSLIGQSLSPLFSRSFYARHNTIVPVIVNACAIVLNAVLSYAWGIRYGLPGVAYAFALSTSLDALLMFILLRRRFFKDSVPLVEFDQSLIKFLTKIIFCSAVMSVVAFATIRVLGTMLNSGSTIKILIESAAAVLLSIVVFLFCAYKIGLEQSNDLLNFLKRLF